MRFLFTVSIPGGVDSGACIKGVSPQTTSHFVFLQQRASCTTAFNSLPKKNWKEGGGKQSLHPPEHEKPEKREITPRWRMRQNVTLSEGIDLCDESMCNCVNLLLEFHTEREKQTPFITTCSTTYICVFKNTPCNKFLCFAPSI